MKVNDMKTWMEDNKKPLDEENGEHEQLDTDPWTLLSRMFDDDIGRYVRKDPYLVEYV